MNRKLALITGGTSSMGLETAKRLVLQNDLALCFKSNEARAEDALRALKLIAPQSHVELFKMRLDSFESSADLVAQVRGRFDQDVSLLINGAGTSYTGFFLQTDFGVFKNLMAEHVLVPIALCKLLLPAMYAQKFGRIINITSISHHRAFGGQSAYATAKAALESFTRSLAAESSHRGITVNAVCPGLTTPLSADLIGGVGRLFTRKNLPKIVNASAIADTVEFLCSDKASAITGAVHVIDHGASL